MASAKITWKRKILFPEYFSWMFYCLPLITIIIQNEKWLDKSLFLMKSNTSDWWFMIYTELNWRNNREMMFIRINRCKVVWKWELKKNIAESKPHNCSEMIKWSPSHIFSVQWASKKRIRIRTEHQELMDNKNNQIENHTQMRVSRVRWMI